MSEHPTAKWKIRTPDVPISRCGVERALNGFWAQFGDFDLWVSSEQHYKDIVEQHLACFRDLAPARPVPLPRTDNVKPTDYSSVNCSGACYCGDDE